MRTTLSSSLRKSLHAYGDAEDVIVTQRCRQLEGKLRGKGMVTEYFSLVDALAVRLSHREIARMSARPDVAHMERSERVHALMDRARGTVGGIPRPNGATGKGVVIAILDTGIAPGADFDGRVLAFRDFINGREEPYDDHGHGTMCAGCAAGNGAQSQGRYQGIAPEAGLVISKTMDHQGAGGILHVLRGMQWVSDHRWEYNIRVVSLSLGVEGEDAVDSLMRGVEALWTQGIVVVAAAGNSGPGEGTVNSPGRARSILTVGAVDDRLRRPSVAAFSSRGPVGDMQKPEVCAPGVRLRTVDNKGPGLFTGTSAATPIVAGAAALLLENHPSWTPDRVKWEMTSKARPIRGERHAQGYGCLYLG